MCPYLNHMEQNHAAGRHKYCKMQIKLKFTLPLRLAGCQLQKRCFEFIDHSPILMRRPINQRLCLDFLGCPV